MTKEQYFKAFIMYVANIRGRVDAIAWTLHYALIVYGIFTLAYFLFKEQYTVIPLVLALLMMVVYSLFNEHKLANADARLHFFMSMAEDYCNKTLEEHYETKA
jgi:hypothetical protein